MTKLFIKFYACLFIIVVIYSVAVEPINDHFLNVRFSNVLNANLNTLMNYQLELFEDLRHDNIDKIKSDISDNKDLKEQIFIYDAATNAELLGFAAKKDTVKDIEKDKVNNANKIKLGADKVVLSTISNSGKYYYVNIYPTKTALYKEFPLLMILSRILIFMLIGIVPCYLLTKFSSHRLKRLSNASRHIANGDYEQVITDGISQGYIEDELDVLINDFNTMAAKLASSEHAKNKVLSYISHELRSPLARLSVALELTNDKFPEAKTYLQRIEKEAENINEKIKGILAIRKTQVQALIDQESISLIKLLNEIVDNANFEFQKQSKSVCLKKLVDVSIYGNKEALLSAFENIIRNALLHTKPDTQVEIRTRTEDDNVFVCIMDHGTGIDDESMVDLIFEPFIRLGNSIQQNISGYGLGLAIAKGVIQAHCGKIKAKNIRQSEQIIGLLVEVSLPIETQVIH